MYNKTSARNSRSGSSWKRSRNNSRPAKRSFSGNSININRFISKANPNAIQKAFTPRYAFSDLKIDESLKRAITKRGFKTPTPIQDLSIPYILAGRDMIGLANTGTGKTAAFLIPLLNKIMANRQEKALIVVPTRELAIQIQEEFVALSQGLNIFSVVLVGGADIRKQITKLRSHYNVLIGTPGRIKDLLNRKVINLSGFANVVLDEADRMLDMGFVPDVRLFLSLVAPKRQVLLFSATFGSELEKLVKQFLINPERISIQTREISKQIDQDIVRITDKQQKIEVLHNLLIQNTFEKVLVFTRTKHGAEKLSKGLYTRGFRSESIHGDKSHNKRQRALKMFKENSINILVATDVAARGLDIPNVSHVINFDVPATFEDYIHRIGRTGRADQKGTALTFVN